MIFTEKLYADLNAEILGIQPALIPEQEWGPIIFSEFIPGTGTGYLLVSAKSSAPAALKFEQAGGFHLLLEEAGYPERFAISSQEIPLRIPHIFPCEPLRSCWIRFRPAKGLVHLEIKIFEVVR